VWLLFILTTCTQFAHNFWDSWFFEAFCGFKGSNYF